MYTASPAFTTAIHASGRVMRSKLAISGGATLDDTIIASMEYKRAVTPDSGFMLGTTIAQQITVMLLDPNGTIVPTDITGKELTPSQGVQVAGGACEYAAMGLFTADQPTRSESTLTVVAYDRMVRLEKPYSSTLAYPSTVGAVLAEAASQCGLTLAAGSILNSSLAVATAIVGATCRQIVGFAAECAAGWARVTRDGKLQIVSLASSPAVEALMPANYFPPMAVADTAWWADGVTVKTSAEDVGMTYGTATRPWAIVGNPFLVDFPTTAINNIVAALAGKQLWPFSVDWQGNPALDPGDPITVQDYKTGTTRATIAGTETLTYNGGLHSKLALVAPSAQQQASDTSINAGKQTGILSRAYTLIKRTVDQIVLTVSNLVSDVELHTTEIAQNADAITLRATKTYVDTQDTTAINVANAASTAAANAQSSATTANSLLADIASDNKLTPAEKQSTKLEWDTIVSEVTVNDAQATTFGITTAKTTYDNAYSALSTYITPLLSNLTTTSDIVGTTFRSTFKAYYDARTALLNAIAAKAKTLADAAQSTANQALIEVTPDAIKLKVGQVGGQNAVLNSDFLFGLVSWTVYSDTSTLPVYTTSDGAGGDNGCVAIAGEIGKAKYIRQYVDDGWRKKVIASCYARSNGITPGATNPYYNLYVEAVDSNGGSHFYNAAEVMPTTWSSWARYTVTIDPATFAPYYIASVTVYGYARDFTGTLCFDRFMVQEADVVTAWQPNPNELKNSSMEIADDHVTIRTMQYLLQLLNGSGEVALEMSATSAGFNQLAATQGVFTSVQTDSLNTGSLMLGGKSFMQTASVDLNVTNYASLQAALNSLPKLFVSGASVRISLVPGAAYVGDNGGVIDVSNFYGAGSLEIICVGSTATMASAVNCVGNSIPILFTNLIFSSGFVGLTLSENPARVTITGCQFLSALTYGITAGGCYFTVASGTFKSTTGVYLSRANAFLNGCVGSCTNAFIAEAGAQIQLYDKVPLGAQIVRGGAGQFGTATATDGSTSTPATPPATQYTKQFWTRWSRSWRKDGNNITKWRTTGTEIYQGAYGGDSFNYGCMLFGIDASNGVQGAGGSQIPAGKTLSNIVGARLFIKRYDSAGSSARMAFKLCALSNTDISLSSKPGSGAASPAPTLNMGVSNGYSVASLAWNEGGWYTIPADLAYQVYLGRALCFYTVATDPYGKLYGVENGSYEPIIEITYT